ncbi:MAG: hypothetical protein F4236_01995 [Acidimicrobiia bacterium]|nr:hypothetical protein [Acidimicrobiia bacterium]MYJ14364.1 hypothetical protein [Acidimicrobiia bacterium]
MPILARSDRTVTCSPCLPAPRPGALRRPRRARRRGAACEAGHRRINAGVHGFEAGHRTDASQRRSADRRAESGDAGNLGDIPAAETIPPPRRRGFHRRGRDFPQNRPPRFRGYLVDESLAGRGAGVPMVAMQQVWPRFIPAVDHLEAYEHVPRPHGTDRPWVMLCMVTSVDGAVSVQGRSAPLGGPTDWAVLTALRGRADAIVVGAGTARSEDYGPPSVAPEVCERRLARGQQAAPLLAVVSAAGELDPAARLFGGTERVRLYLAGAAPKSRRQALAAVAEVRTVGDREADPAAITADLAAEGRSLILLEGGPRLNAGFADADLIDEFCITRSPLLAPGGPGMIEGAEPGAGLSLHLDRLLTADGMTFARYLRRREPHESA